MPLKEPFHSQIQSGAKTWDSRKIKPSAGHPFVRPEMNITFTSKQRKLVKQVTSVFVVANPLQNIKDFGDVPSYKNYKGAAIMYEF